uniref:Growth arrest-specific protein 8 domain-containing protein n=1 Tax=Chromera velia CCMP2878 TaxID=1169474 RepID=A0A0G4G5R0_9ALVE|eukprot:Cvel_20252.t1-p1 / transcript=Cvel_20252.t1 / gene=Cvel_20252 / organism=Chromera_velia_CCMP2878 / gene_product=Growth arrest-specific protein 8 homolog, putative / transcript_product=Growth arrest-specific protein 8 homolog, putative / location=Cvel_scaffold1806:5654-11040(-) / protein_length=385 / sequence_SO=supercontig / SO=protein_coding / is_pseudo=false
MRCADEERAFAELLQEREKLNYFWVIEKKTKEEKHAELRAKEREMQDREEKHQLELNEREDGLWHDLRDVQTELCVTENGHTQAVRMMRLLQDKAVYSLRTEFEEDAKQALALHKQRMTRLREGAEEARRNEIATITAEKDAHVSEVIAKNAKDFAAIKRYYLDRTSSNLDLIKRLKEDHEELKRAETKDTKTLADLQSRYKSLNEPLKKARAEVERLTADLKLHTLDKKRLEAVKETLHKQENLLGNAQLQQEVDEQRLRRLTSDRDGLAGKFQKVLYSVQQKSGLKNLILEKKLDSLEETLEVSDSQMSEILVSANLDRATAGGISEKLDQVIRYKNDIIQALHEESQKIKEAHRQVVRAFQSKMMEAGVPVENTGFEVQLMA